MQIMFILLFSVHCIFGYCLEDVIWKGNNEKFIWQTCTFSGLIQTFLMSFDSTDGTMRSINLGRKKSDSTEGVDMKCTASNWIFPSTPVHSRMSVGTRDQTSERPLSDEHMLPLRHQRLALCRGDGGKPEKTKTHEGMKDEKRGPD